MTALVLILSAAAAATATDCLEPPLDCEDVRNRGHNTTGVYRIYPERTTGVSARCDMDTGAGGWTVIQRRVSDSDFYRDWAQYEAGFGDPSANFWLGNSWIHAITQQACYQLRVDMTRADGWRAYAVYDKFTVGDAGSKYRLQVSGYHGNAGDSLSRHNGNMFSTKDNDNDAFSQNCAQRYHGAFWYDSCHSVNVNGVYGSSSYGMGINWLAFTGYYSSLLQVEMMVKKTGQAGC